MKNTVKVSALLFTSAFLLGACGQDKKDETTVATTQATTVTPTTATPTTVYSLEDAQKAVFEISDRVGTITMTFYYIKEIEPNLRLTDDNTVSYSEFRDKLLKAGYVEK